MKLTILGAGYWGLTLAHLWQNKFDQISVWGTHLETINQKWDILKKTNNQWPKHIQIETELKTAIKNSELFILAVSSSGVRSVCHQLSKLTSSPYHIINVAKGLETGSLKRMSQVIEEELHTKAMVLSGPNLAFEILQEKPTASVLAGENIALLEKYQALLTTPYFRIYTNLDLIGVELGGTLKNVMAIASGFIAAQNLGNNAQGAILTRGMNEITRLSLKLGAKLETLYGLAGLGDLIATASSELSRNYRVGLWLGQGKKLPEITKELGSVAEGIETAKNIVTLATKYQIEVPLASAVYQLISTDLTPETAIQLLMQRQLKEE